MNKEVKELIDKLKDNNNTDDYDENGYFFALYISDKDLLLDYINQLEVNRDEVINKIKNTVFMTSRSTGKTLFNTFLKELVELLEKIERI